MSRVLEECSRTAVDFAPDPVHNLRVALRRCRSMADGFMAIDPDPAWREMKKAGRRLFRSLGELRDVHVMQDWVHHFDTVGDPVATTLLQHLAAREAQFREVAREALQQFDAKQWRRWTKLLPRRAGRLRPGSLLFKHLALEHWAAAYDLHRRALKNRSQVGFHNLRIGIKRFRYIVENFLPQQHLAWKDDLKQLQDLLGEVHDLDVLWSTALQWNVFPNTDLQSAWHTKIVEEREERLKKYSEKMVGPSALWHVWRADLPQREQVEIAAVGRLRFWASVLDPDFKHSEHVARLAVELYNKLQAVRPWETPYDARRILRMAALLRDVGRAKDGNAHHKESYRMIAKLEPPFGWSRKDLDLAAVVGRYHRGALPSARQKALASVPVEQRKDIVRLAAILRLANAFDSEHDGHIKNLQVSESRGFLVIAAEGYLSRSRSAEAVAAARHLLELVYRRPVMVRRKTPALGARH